MPDTFGNFVIGYVLLWLMTFAKMAYLIRKLHRLEKRLPK